MNENIKISNVLHKKLQITCFYKADITELHFMCITTFCDPDSVRCPKLREIPPNSANGLSILAEIDEGCLVYSSKR